MKKTNLLIICITSLLTLSCSKNNKVEQTYFESMNTFMKVQAYGENAKEANEAAQKYIGQLERIISATKEESDIYKLNHSKLENFSGDYFDKIYQEAINSENLDIEEPSSKDVNKSKSKKKNIKEKKVKKIENNNNDYLIKKNKKKKKSNVN